MPISATPAIFQDTAAYGGISVSLDNGAETEAIPGELVTGNYFRVLGVAPAHGRTFVAGRGSARHAGARRGGLVCVLAEPARRVDPSAVGSEIHLNGSPVRRHRDRAAAIRRRDLGRAPDVWLPMALQQEVRPPSAGLRRSLGSADLLSARGPRWLSIVARVRPGTPRPEQTAALDVLARRLQEAYPQTNGPRAFNAVALGEGPGVRASTRPMLYLLAVVGRAGAADRVRQRHQPARGTLGVTAARDGGAGQRSAPAARGWSANG